MATSQIDVLQCELNTPGAQARLASQRLTPDAASHACIASAYDLPLAFDVGVSPVFARNGCNATTTANCYAVQPRATVTIPGPSAVEYIPLNFTTFSNNGALINNEVSLEVWLSQDSIPGNGDDVQLALIEPLLGFLSFETRRRQMTVTVLGSHLSVVGANYQILVRLVTSVAETNTGNNVTDLRVTLRRAF